MIYIQPLGSSVIRKKRTNASATIIFLFIFLSKPNIILVSPATLHYSINFQWVFRMQLIGGGGRESTKLFRMLNIPWYGFEKKSFTKIEAHAGMAKRLVRDLAIEEALQEEIKHTLEHNNQSYDEWCALVSLLFHPEEPLQSPNLSPAVRPCLHVLQFL